VALYGPSEEESESLLKFKAGSLENTEVMKDNGNAKVDSIKEGSSGAKLENEFNEVLEDIAINIHDAEGLGGGRHVAGCVASGGGGDVGNEADAVVGVVPNGVKVLEEDVSDEPVMTAALLEADSAPATNAKVDNVGRRRDFVVDTV
jgi:hypothetical protein